MHKYDELQTLLQSLQEDFEKFYGQSNKVAGTRLRVGMQRLKKLAQDVRVEVQELKRQ